MDGGLRIHQGLAQMEANQKHCYVCSQLYPFGRFTVLTREGTGNKNKAFEVRLHKAQSELKIAIPWAEVH